jgi:hypothetical protein
MHPFALVIAVLLPLVLAVSPSHALQPGGQVEDIWKPAATPAGGVPWKLLESTRETTRTDAQGYVRAKPVFPAAVKALDGKRVKVAGFMMPLENAPRQGHFVLLAYPPGCPFHMHAGPTQFIEVKATTPFPVEIEKAIIVEGTLELTGEDEGGIFYRLKNARPA